MRFFLEAVVVIIFTSACRGAVISEPEQQEILDYKSKIAVLHSWLTSDCGPYANLTSVSFGNAQMLKTQYQQMLRDLLNCHTKSQQGENFYIV